MRLSIDDLRSMDRERYELAMNADVYLDGEKVERCTMADEEKGEVEFYIPQDDPRWKNELSGADYWPIEKKTGKVVIVDRRKA